MTWFYIFSGLFALLSCSFELSPVPYSLANADGSLRKGTKSVLCSLLEKDVNVVQQLTALPNPTVVIIDGMAIIQMSKSAGTSTFRDLSENLVLQHLHCPALFKQLCASPCSLWPILGELHKGRRAWTTTSIRWSWSADRRSYHSSPQAMEKVHFQSQE